MCAPLHSILRWNHSSHRILWGRCPSRRRLTVPSAGAVSCITCWRYFHQTSHNACVLSRNMMCSPWRSKETEAAVLGAHHKGAGPVYFRTTRVHRRFQVAWQTTADMDGWHKWLDKNDCRSMLQPGTRETGLEITGVVRSGLRPSVMRMAEVTVT